MKVLVTSPRGFCAGVVRAIDIVELALEKFGSPVYVKHQIVHNPNVVKDVEDQGAITVENVSDIPEGSVVVFSAHGSAPEDYNIAKTKNLKVIDATCPLVTKVHNEAKKYNGFSDHTLGIIAPIVFSVLKKQQGSKYVIIEKHVKLKNSKGPDASSSIDTSQLAEMVSNVRKIR